MFDSEVEETVSKTREACGACGNIMTVGWEASVQLKTQRSRRQKKRTEKISERSREMIYTCATCSKVTRISVKPMEVRKKTVIQKSSPILATNQNKASSQANSSILPGPPTVGQSTKKRSKRKNGGLEALLANKKAADARNSGFGLDLMDFMKKS